MKRKPEPELMDDAAEARAYAAAGFSEVNQAFVDRLVELAGERPSARAVDLGTGPADIPIRLAKARPRWHVVAVDASKAMLDIARRDVLRARLGRRIELVLADAKATHLPAHSFDVIFSNSILHHITEAREFWAEVKRLAAPGTTIFLRDLARPETPARARQIVRQYAGNESQLLQDEYYRSLLSAYTVEEVLAQLDAAGVDGLRVEMVTDRHLDVWGEVR